MKEKPMLFSGEMVQAILAGRKTQTRRVMKVKCDDVTAMHHEPWPFNWSTDGNDTIKMLPCPFGEIGDRLWVKETFQPVQLASEVTQWRYRATDKKGLANWKPSIFMPRKASRIALEITDVRVERLQSISDADAIAEGVTIKPDASIAEIVAKGETTAAQFEYYALWCAINGQKSWDANPWVWVVAFKKVFNAPDERRPE